MLKIDDDYVSFCVNEAALYLYNQLTKTQDKPDKQKLTGNKFMQTLAIWKRK